MVFKKFSAIPLCQGGLPADVCVAALTRKKSKESSKRNTFVCKLLLSVLLVQVAECGLGDARFYNWGGTQSFSVDLLYKPTH